MALLLLSIIRVRHLDDSVLIRVLDQPPSAAVSRQTPWEFVEFLTRHIVVRGVESVRPLPAKVTFPFDIIHFVAAEKHGHCRILNCSPFRSRIVPLLLDEQTIRDLDKTVTPRAKLEQALEQHA